jgi:hypothetical protein
MKAGERKPSGLYSHRTGSIWSPYMMGGAWPQSRPAPSGRHRNRTAVGARASAGTASHSLQLDLHAGKLDS